MKRIALLPLTLLTLISSSFAQTADFFSGSATYSFESEFVFRGVSISGDTFTPSAEGRILDRNTTYYFGARTALPTQKDDNRTKMHEYYVGAEFPVLDDFKLDIGLSHYQFLPLQDGSNQEFILGLTWDTLLSPAIYAFLDFDGEMATFEASVGHTIPLDLRTGLMFSAFLGTSDFYGGSTYAGLMVDLSYSFTRYARATLGGRAVKLDPNSEGKVLGREGDTRYWWGVSFTAGF